MPMAHAHRCKSRRGVTRRLFRRNKARHVDQARGDWRFSPRLQMIDRTEGGRRGRETGLRSTGHMFRVQSDQVRWAHSFRQHDTHLIKEGTHDILHSWAACPNHIKHAL